MQKACLKKHEPINSKVKKVLETIFTTFKYAFYTLFLMGWVYNFLHFQKRVKSMYKA